MPDHLRPTFRVLDDQGAEVGARQGPRGAQGAAASVVRPRDAGRSPTSPGLSATGPDHVDVRHHRAVLHADPRRPRGARLSRRWSTRAARSACGWPPRPRSRRPSTVSAYDACCCSRSRHRSPRCVDGLDNTAKLGLAASPYPNVRALIDDCVVAAAGELVDQVAARARRGRLRRAGRAGRTRAAPTASAAVLHQVLRVLARVAPGRQGAARPRGDGAAAGDERPARPARAAGARRVRRRGGCAGAARVPALPAAR